MPNKKEEKQSLQALLAEGQIAKVLEKTKDLALKSDHSEVENEIILLSARYNEIQKKIHGGTISNDQADISLNRIRSSITYLIDKVFQHLPEVFSNPSSNDHIDDSSKQNQGTTKVKGNHNIIIQDVSDSSFEIKVNSKDSDEKDKD